MGGGDWVWGLLKDFSAEEVMESRFLENGSCIFPFKITANHFEWQVELGKK